MLLTPRHAGFFPNVRPAARRRGPPVQSHPPAVLSGLELHLLPDRARAGDAQLGAANDGAGGQVHRRAAVLGLIPLGRLVFVLLLGLVLVWLLGLVLVWLLGLVLVLLGGVALILARALIAGALGLVVAASVVVAVAALVARTAVAVLVHRLMLFGRHALGLGIAGDGAADCCA